MFSMLTWCEACGAVQWGLGSRSCKACGERNQFDSLVFEDIYAAYAGPLRRFVRRLAADRGIPESVVDTEGVVQDTFVILLRGANRPIRNPAAWLFTVARNMVTKAAAAQSRIAPGEPADHLDDGAATWATLATPWADAEDIRAAREVMHEIAGLPGHQKVATYLRHVQGWSLVEIGGYLDCAASTAGVHIFRGTATVRSRLSEAPDVLHRYIPKTVRLARKREARRSAAWAAAGILVAAAAAGGTAAAAARALGMPWRAEATEAVIAAILVLSVPAVRWLARAGRLSRRYARLWISPRYVRMWLLVQGGFSGLWRKARRRLREEIDARRRQRRFNRWLRTGRPLVPPTGGCDR